MQKMIILGAGQFGRAFASLLNTANFELIAYGDNNVKLHGMTIGSVPVLPVGEAAAMEPDCMLAGVTDELRSAQLYAQVIDAGFHGEFLRLFDLYRLLDIRSAVMYRIAVRLKQQSIPGNIAELGVYQGFMACKLNALFPERTLHLFDTFEGFDVRDVRTENDSNYSRAQQGDFSDTSKEAVISKLPFPDKAVMHKGYFPETAVGLGDELYCLVSLDADLYAPILAGLEYFYPRLSPGGVIVLHDYNNERFRGAAQAVAAFEKNRGRLMLVPLCDLHGSAVIVHP